MYGAVLAFLQNVSSVHLVIHLPCELQPTKYAQVTTLTANRSTDLAGASQAYE
jgi:hypothetical protein